MIKAVAFVGNFAGNSFRINHVFNHDFTVAVTRIILPFFDKFKVPVFFDCARFFIKRNIQIAVLYCIDNRFAYCKTHHVPIPAAR